MNDAILTHDQIIALTGATQTGKQKEVLSRSGIFFVDKLGGGISLTWGHVNNPGLNRARTSFTSEPNFEAMK